MKPKLKLKLKHLTINISPKKILTRMLFQIVNFIAVVSIILLSLIAVIKITPLLSGG